jgi:hypothetical protein
MDSETVVAFVAEPLSDANVSSLLMTAIAPIVAIAWDTEVVEAPGSA